jgi:hypothetical protein
MPVSCAQLAGNLSGILGSSLLAYPAWQIYKLLKKTAQQKLKLSEIKKDGDDKAKKRTYLGDAMVEHLEQAADRWGALNWTIAAGLAFTILSDLLPFLEAIGFNLSWLCAICRLAKTLGFSIDCPA